MNSLLTALKALTTYDLEQLVGKTIVRAVRGAYETNREIALAQLVIDRFGSNLLNKKEIRCAFIDILTESQALSACENLGLEKKERSPQAVLLDRYSGHFNQGRAEEFVRLFGLSEDLIPPINVEDRESSVYICAEYNQKLISRGVLHPYQRRVKDTLIEKLNSGRPHPPC